MSNKQDLAHDTYTSLQENTLEVFSDVERLDKFEYSNLQVNNYMVIFTKK